MSESQREALGRLATRVGVYAVTVVLFWRQPVDSFRTTWKAVAAGVDPVSLWGTVAIWDASRNVVAPEPSAALVLSALVGPNVEWLVFAGLLVGLAVTAAAAIRGLASTLGAGSLSAEIVGMAAGFLALVHGGGFWPVIAATPFVFLMASLFRESRTTSLLASVLALAVLSRGGLLLALVVLVIAGLLGRRVGVPLAVAAIATAALPEPEWARFLRLETRHLFAESGPYGFSAIDWLEALGLEGAGWRPWVFGLVWSSALVGAVRSGSRGGALFLTSVGLAAFTTPLVPFDVLDVPRGAGAGDFLGVGLSSLGFHPVARITSVFAGLLALALVARVGRGTTVSFLVSIALVIAHLPRRDPTEGPPDPRLVERLARGSSPLLVLPMSVASDFRWRTALPGNPFLRNGTQAVLERNPALLSRELARRSNGDLQRFLNRLGIDRVLLPPGRVPSFGEVLAVGAGRALVRVGSSPPGFEEPACVNPAGWTIEATRGHPEVSVPERAFDGDPQTRWGTGGRQRAGDRFEIRFNERLRVDRLRLDFSRFPHDYPRGFRAAASTDLRRWTIVDERTPFLGETRWAGEFPYEDGGRFGKIEIPLGGVTATGLRIELTEGAKHFDWSIGELCLVGASVRS